MASVSINLDCVLYCSEKYAKLFKSLYSVSNFPHPFLCFMLAM